MAFPVHKSGKDRVTTVRVNRESPIPAYYQIALDIRERIQRQEWQVGDQIPNESDLAKEYNVSRVTLRQALAELVKDGLLNRQRGSGTFVNQKPVSLVHDMSLPLHFGRHLREMGYDPSWQPLNAQAFNDPLPEVVERLKLNSQTPVIYLKRLLLMKNQPIAIHRSWLSEELCPGITQEPLLDNSLSATLSERYQLVPARTENWFEVIRATGKDAKLIEADPDTPLILLRMVSYLKDGTPLEFSMSSWFGDRIRFHFFIEGHPGPSPDNYGKPGV